MPVVRYLVEAGAAVKQAMEGGFTPLFVAAWEHTGCGDVPRLARFPGPFHELGVSLKAPSFVVCTSARGHVTYMCVLGSWDREGPGRTP